MKASPFLLLLFPLFMRMYLEPPDVLNVTLSLVPFLFLIIASYGPSIWKDEEVEHLARHIIFTAVFAMSAGVSIDWPYVMEEIKNINVARIILFVLVAGGTQLWFCIAHILENSGSSFVRTHQGDAAAPRRRRRLQAHLSCEDSNSRPRCGLPRTPRYLPGRNECSPPKWRAS